MGKPAKMGSPQGQTVGVGEGITMTATPIAHHLPMSFCFYGGLGFFHTFPVVEFLTPIPSAVSSQPTVISSWVHSPKPSTQSPSTTRDTWCSLVCAGLCTDLTLSCFPQTSCFIPLHIWSPEAPSLSQVIFSPWWVSLSVWTSPHPQPPSRGAGPFLFCLVFSRANQWI